MDLMANQMCNWLGRHKIFLCLIRRPKDSRLFIYHCGHIYDLQSNMSVEDYQNMSIFYFKQMYLFELVLGDSTS